MLGPEVELRRTPYDLGKAAERIRGTHYPQAEDFARNSVLEPPTEQAMLEVFSRVELNDDASRAASGSIGACRSGKAFAMSLPESFLNRTGDNCLLTTNFRFVDLPFSRLLA